jgi:hypothetical protein
MRTSILTPLIGVIAFCAVVTARADDNPAQAAARAALMQKMQDLDSQQGQPNVVSNQMSVPDNQPPAETQPATLPPPADMESSNAVPEPQPVTIAPVETQTNPIPVAPAEVGLDYVTTNAPVAAPINVETQSAAPAKTETPGFFSRIFHPLHQTDQSSAAMEVEQPKPVKPDNTVQNAGFAPVQAPPPPVSPEQEAELHALLQRYEANQITPDEYQAQRAAIIGNR